jgi:hypothetical protein
MSDLKAIANTESFEIKYIDIYEVPVEKILTLFKNAVNPPLGNDFILVEINVALVDNNWKKSKLYLSDKLSDKNYTALNKYTHARKSLSECNELYPPSLSIGDDNIISFYDGRNRFSNLRDLGVKTMCVWIDTELYENFKPFIVSD